MASWFVDVVISLHLYLHLVSAISNPEWTRENTFCYDPNEPCGPPSWPGTCSTGDRQSPIDIPAPKVSIYKKWTQLTLNPFYLEEQTAFYAGNNGHSFQLQFGQGDNAHSELLLSGAGLKRQYSFAQLHFHWGSEHTVNGLRYPLELHIVHYSTTYGSLMDAMNADQDPGALAVLAVLFQIGGHNQALDSLTSVARRRPEVTPELPLFPSHSINVADLLPRKYSFIRYHGSLTTPPCTENVVWTVFNHPVSISVEQLATFQNLRNEEGLLYSNWRPAQSLNGRTLDWFGGLPPWDRIQKRVYSPGGGVIAPITLHRGLQWVGEWIQLLGLWIVDNFWVRRILKLFGPSNTFLGFY